MFRSSLSGRAKLHNACQQQDANWERELRRKPFYMELRSD
jgi:hypothetical protein